MFWIQISSYISNFCIQLGLGLGLTLYPIFVNGEVNEIVNALKRMNQALMLTSAHGVNSNQSSLSCMNGLSLMFVIMST